MTPALEETIYPDFVTSASDGSAVDADTLPTAQVFEDANAVAILSPVVTKRSLGNYYVIVPCTAANGFELNKTYNVIVSATIGGINAKSIIKTFQIRQLPLSDKTGYSLTSGERTAIANEVEAQIIDETDSEKVLTAITDKIASVNPSLSGLTLSAIASQVRTELTAELGRIDTTISSRLAPTIAGRTLDVTLEGNAGIDWGNIINANTIINFQNTTIGSVSTLFSSVLVNAVSVQSAVGLSSANLDSQLSTIRTSIPTVGAIASQITTDHGSGSYVDSGGGGTAPTAGEVADAVWDELLSGHVISGSAGQAMSAAGAAGDPLLGEVETGYTLKDVMKLLVALSIGKTSGGGSNQITFRNLNDSLDRIKFTLDKYSNRLLVEVDLS